MGEIELRSFLFGNSSVIGIQYIFYSFQQILNLLNKHESKKKLHNKNMSIPLEF